MGAFTVDVSVTKTQNLTLTMILEAINEREAEALAVALVRTSLIGGGAMPGSAMVQSRAVRYHVHTASADALDS